MLHCLWFVRQNLSLKSHFNNNKSKNLVLTLYAYNKY